MSAPEPGSLGTPRNAADEAEWVAVAVLSKPWGSRGELFAFAQGGDLDRFLSLKTVYLFRDAAPGRPKLAGETFTLEDARDHSGRLVLKFQGVDDISAAEQLNGAEVRVPISERAPLEEGYFFHSDLIGCDVVDCRSSESLGRVLGFEDAGSSGLLTIEGGWSVPFVRSICVEIDPARKRIVVDLPEGLKDLNRP